MILNTCTSCIKEIDDCQDAISKSVYNYPLISLIIFLFTNEKQTSIKFLNHHFTILAVVMYLYINIYWGILSLLFTYTNSSMDSDKKFFHPIFVRKKWLLDLKERWQFIWCSCWEFIELLSDKTSFHTLFILVSIILFCIYLLNCGVHL